MNRYTVAELRSKTREILNEALIEPVIITRYDDEFVLERVITDPKRQSESLKTTVGAISQADKPKKPADIKPGVVPGACVHGAAPGFCKVQKCPNSKRV